jgi:DNA-binding NarL/FixJ family response regulator
MYGAGGVPPNGLHAAWAAQNSKVKLGNGAVDSPASLTDGEGSSTSVLVAVESTQVREALVAMLAALDRFRVIAEVDNADAAVEAARSLRPNLALVEQELSGCGGWWAIQEIQAERLADVVVALGRRAEGALAQHCGARTYVQMGTAPRDLLIAVEAAMDQQARGLSAAQAEQDLLADAHPVLEEPALVDL